MVSLPAEAWPYAAAGRSARALFMGGRHCPNICGKKMSNEQNHADAVAHSQLTPHSGRSLLFQYP